MIIHRQFLRLQREIILQYSSVTSYFDGFKEKRIRCLCELQMTCRKRSWGQSAG